MAIRITDHWIKAATSRGKSALWDFAYKNASGIPIPKVEDITPPTASQWEEWFPPKSPFWKHGNITEENARALGIYYLKAYEDEYMNLEEVRKISPFGTPIKKIIERLVDSYLRHR